MSKRPLLANAILTALALAPRAASADVFHGVDKALYLPVGVTIGGAANSPLGGGVVLGAEVSLAHLTRDIAWIGGYTDAIHDFGAKATRFSVGPELGFGPLGLDCGLLLEARNGHVSPGTTVRFLLSASLVAAYARWGHVVDTMYRDFGEFGVLLKFPFRVGAKRNWRQAPSPGYMAPAQTEPRKPPTVDGSLEFATPPPMPPTPESP